MKLEKNFIFLNDFSAQEKENLNLITFPPKSYLIRKDEFSQDIYIILDGFCNVLKEMHNGTTVISYKLSKGDVIGLSEIISTPIRRYSSIRAHNEVKAWKMNKEEFIYYYSNYSSFSFYILSNVINRLHNALDFSLNCTTDTLGANIRNYLCNRYKFYSISYPENYTKNIKIDESRQEISEFLGIEVRSLNRYLLRFKENKEISIIKGKIHINQNQYDILINKD